MRRRDLVLSALFVAMLALPLALAPALDGFAARENRKAAPFPALALDGDTLAAFAEGFEAWLRDHFALRRQLITARNAATLRVLGLSASRDVVLGRDGFLYFRSELNAHAAGAELTPAQLEAWRRVLEARRDLLAARGIRHVFLPAPDKSSIYPETAPAPGRSFPLDALAAYLAARSTVVVVDARTALLRARGDGLVYEKTDTHWNNRGAAVAAQLVAAREGLSLPPLAERVALEDGGDLAQMLSLEGLLREQRPRLSAAAPAAPAARKGRALLLHDSFGLRLLPFLQLAFAEVTAVVSPALDDKLLAAAHPDVVIDEIVERNLVDVPPASWQPAPPRSAHAAP